jgi:D-alanyl-D-alanine carboxypeptidase (penicillin-binding protein 5/6)
VVADLDSGVVLAAKDPHGRNRPASVIKVLLSLVVLRELKLDMGVTGTQEDADMEGSKVGRFGVGPGGQYTVRQLLQGLLLNSGNDAANALARQLGGTPETLTKMNALAKGLGALDTRAATPSGLDGPGMTTSAYDMAVVFRAAMSNPDFVAIMAAREVTFPGFGPNPPFTIRNQDTLSSVLSGAVDLGSKSGFTDDARQTYAAAAEQNGRRLLVVMMRGEPTITSQAAKLLNYGFSALKPGSTEPVGQLVDKAPQTSPQPTPPAPTHAAIGQDGAQDAPHSLGTAATDKRMSDAFGNWGGPLTGAAGVFLLFALVMWWRKRKAKLAATQRTSDDFSDAL